jgi:hypothetical protein
MMLRRVNWASRRARDSNKSPTRTDSPMMPLPTPEITPPDTNTYFILEMTMLTLPADRVFAGGGKGKKARKTRRGLDDIPPNRARKLAPLSASRVLMPYPRRHDCCLTLGLSCDWAEWSTTLTPKRCDERVHLAVANIYGQWLLEAIMQSLSGRKALNATSRDNPSVS